MLNVFRLNAVRSEQELFSNLTFSLSPGQWCWVKGSNGSGKSTLLKLLAGLLPLNTGAGMTWKGEKVSRFEVSFLQDILYLGHKPALHPALTAIENLTWLTAIGAKQQGEQGAWHSKGAWHSTGENLKNSVGMRSFLASALHSMGVFRPDLPCEHLSFGQRQRVCLARLLLSLGKLWILDEPCTGLDHAGQLCLEECLKMHLARGGIAVIASHAAFKTVRTPQNIIELQRVEVQDLCR